jgi:protein transport protein SEC61 subunit gamma-like protein
MSMQKLKSFYAQCKRVFKVTKKPSRQEFMAIVKISGLGMLLIGFIGFIVHVIEQLL